MKLVINVLTLLLVVSCNSGSNSVTPEISSAGFDSPKSLNATGSTYALPDYLTRAASFGGSIDYSCGDTECVVSGSVMGYYLNHSSQIVYIDFSGATLTKNANGYKGQISYNNPPYVGSFNLTIGNDFKLKYLDNGNKCIYSIDQADQQQYEDFVNAKIDLNRYEFSPVEFSAGASMATCNM